MDVRQHVPMTAPAAVRPPDLAIHAGAGILRPPLLAIPRLGTLNATGDILCIREVDASQPGSVAERRAAAHC